MESIAELKIAQRQQAFEHWLHTYCGQEPLSMRPLPGDASFRRYVRIYTAAGSFIAMDAHHENCRPYVAIANALRNMQLNAPFIHAADLDQGFLLITDYGDDTYLKALNPENADVLYTRALNALTVMQACRQVEQHSIPAFSADFMQQEWAWHKEWFAQKLLHLPASPQDKHLDQCMELIIAAAVLQPQVFMHRDYHSANLMRLAGDDVAILDFQDAFMGPVTYDLVSLLRDCYIDWPEVKVEAWVLFYWQQLIAAGVVTVDEQVFLRWFDWMGLQRHLKALLTFARKHVRDQQSQYLQSVPRTLTYLQTVSQRYPEFSALHDYLGETVQPAFKQMVSTCSL